VTYWVNSLLADLFDKLDEHKTEYKLVPRKMSITIAWYNEKSISEMAKIGILYKSDKSKAIDFCYDRDVMHRRIFSYISSFNKSKIETEWEPGIRSLQFVAGGMTKIEGKTMTSFFSNQKSLEKSNESVNFVKSKNPQKSKTATKSAKDFFISKPSTSRSNQPVNFVKTKMLQKNREGNR